MKKILLIVAVVLCLAIAGTALAITRNNADPMTGTLTADSYIKLSLDQCEAADLTVTAGSVTTYTIQCDVTRSASVTDTCTLTITLANDTANSKTLDNVTVTLYSDANRQTAVANGSRTGAGAIEIAGLTQNTTYYAAITLADGLTEAQTQAVGGTMTLSVAKVAAQQSQG